MEINGQKCDQDYFHLHRDDVPTRNPTIHFQPFDLGEMIEVFRSFYDDLEGSSMFDDEFCDTIKYFAASCFSDCLFVARDEYQKFLIVGALIKSYNMLNPGQNILFVTNSDEDSNLQKGQLYKTGLSVKILKTLSSIHNVCDDTKILVCSISFLKDNFEAVSSLIPLESVSLIIMNEILLNNEEYLFLMKAMTDSQKPRIFATTDTSKFLKMFGYKNWSRSAKLQYIHHGLQGKVSESILDAILQGAIEDNILEQEPLSEFEGENCHIEFFKFNSFDKLKLVLHDMAASPFVKIRYKWQGDRVDAKIKFKPKNMSLSRILMNINKNSSHYGLSTWFNVSGEKNDTKRFDALVVEFEQLNTFSFTNLLDIEEPLFEGKVRLVMNQKQISISNINQSFIVKKDKFDDCFLIEESHNAVRIFMCLKSPPSYIENENLSTFLFENRSYNLCLRKSRVFDDELNEIRIHLKQWSSNVHNIVNVPQNYISRSVSLPIEDPEKFCLIKQWQSNFSSILPQNLPKEIVNKLVTIQSNRDLELTLMNNTPKRFKELKLKEYRIKNESEYEYNSYFDANSKYIKVPSLTITPSRIIYNSMKLIRKNRVHRYYDDPKYYISVNFQSENGSWNPWHNENVRNFFRNILKNGIPIAGRTYKFLGCSNSQLRETDGRCWFSNLDNETVYAKIGDFSNLKNPNPGRKLTRLAHAFSSSIETVAVDHEKYLNNVVDDIMGGSDGTIPFSDGIGRGSVELFEKISKKLRIVPTPTAFQIRVGGIKGVISISNQKEDLTIRKSMKKFESDHNIIEVLNFNRTSPFYLNRAIVLILSQLGVADDVFIDMQKECLNLCIDAVTSNGKNALKFVNCPLFIEEWTRLGDKIVTDPFFRKILKKQVQMRIFSIANKTKIKVDEGRMLMGVLDETGELEYGEVFVQIIDDTEKPPHILDCEILLSRNPCVLPSDIRRLRATSNVSPVMKKLYKNVVVFPSKGENSHANECAGGDLDGDIYSVIWDKKLIPKNLKSPGREVVSVKIISKEDKKESGKHISVDDMIDYFCLFHHRNVLGKLANAHLALSELFGIENERTMDLAKVVVAETDAPIKGFTVDEEKYKDLLPDKYPHYMRKFDRDSFHSKKVLGKMFDEAWTLAQAIKKTSSYEILPQHYRVASANAKSDVDHWYSLYCEEIYEFMIKFKLNNEVELFLGLPSSDKNSRDNFKKRKENSELIMHVLEQFWMKWKARFENFKRKTADNQMELLNWYNRPNRAYCPAESFSLLALPYIKKSETCTNLVANSIETSIRRWVMENKQNFITLWLQDELIRSKLQNYMKNKCFFIVTDISNLGFGNSSHDLNLWTNGDLQTIKSTLLNKNLPKNKIKRKLKEIRLTYHSRSLVITNDTAKLRIIGSIAKMFDTNKKLWPTLRVLLRWARIANITDWHHGSRPKEFMTTYNFILLFIEQVLGKSLYIEDHTEKKITQDRLEKWMTPEFSSVSNNHCGKLFLDFLRMLSDSNQRRFILKKRDPNLKIQFLKRNFDELQKKANHALFIFSLYDGRICEIMNESKVQPVVRNQFRYRPTRLNHRKKSSQITRPQAFVTDNFQVKLEFKNNTIFMLSIIFEDNKYCVEVVCTHNRNVKNEEPSIKSKIVINAISYENQNNYYVMEYKNFEKFFLAQMTDNENDSKKLEEKEATPSMEKQDRVAVSIKNRALKEKRQILKRRKPTQLSCFLLYSEIIVNPLKPSQKLTSQFKMNANNINIFKNENGFTRVPHRLALPIKVDIFITWNNFYLKITVDHHGKVLHINVDDQEKKTEKTAPTPKDYDQLQSQLFDRIICTSEFVKQIIEKNLTQQSLNCNCANPVQLTEFNVTLRKISVSKRVSLYSNWCRDTMIHSTEFSGTFSDNTNGFEWHPVKKGLKVDIDDEGSIYGLCEKTFGMALALFRLENKNF